MTFLDHNLSCEMPQRSHQVTLDPPVAATTLSSAPWLQAHETTSPSLPTGDMQRAAGAISLGQQLKQLMRMSPQLLPFTANIMHLGASRMVFSTVLKVMVCASLVHLQGNQVFLEFALQCPA